MCIHRKESLKRDRTKPLTSSSLVNDISPIFLISPEAIPWCLKPRVQQALGGWDAIIAAKGLEGVERYYLMEDGQI